MQLREYQLRTLEALRASYASGHRAPCLVAPTGSGKTVLGAEVVRSALTKGNRVLFNAHRAELIEQTADKLRKAGLNDIRIVKAGGHSGSLTAPVTVASVQTITRWSSDKMPDVGLVVFDEAHHCPARTFLHISDSYPNARMLGLTATPQRADGKPLGDIFDDLVVAASVKELTELGHLVPCRVWAPPGILDTGELAMSPLEAYQKHGAEQRAICFCVTVEHANTVAAEFNAGGITSAVLHGGIGKAMRAQILSWFREGQIRVLCNVHVLTEGFDDPACAVGILCRKPEHAGTYLQMVGRILRPSPGKTGCTLIDLCGSSLVHGTPEMDRKFSLDGRAISKAERDAIRQCPTCGGVFLAVDVDEGCCPQCGVELPRREVKSPRSVNSGLVEASNTDQLRINLQAAAKRSRRTPEWVTRAHAAITGRRSA